MALAAFIQKHNIDAFLATKAHSKTVLQEPSADTLQLNLFRVADYTDFLPTPYLVNRA